MALEIKHVADLMGLKFRIPSYQRGYRWERKQITQLLDDLLEYSNNLKKARDDDRGSGTRSHEDAMGFYCLQPLAVSVITNEDSGDFTTMYDVIDGQQRLTTVYLILNYIASKRDELPYAWGEKITDNLYILDYESREKSFIEQKKFINISDSLQNIDYYFMARGYQTINEWFSNHRNAERDIIELILPQEYNMVDKEANDRALHDVRFIWYVDDGNQSSSHSSVNSIETFNNLNYGKIGLNASELVKALLFQCDLYDREKHELAKKDAFTRSMKWSLMETQLQEKNFWSMLTSDEDCELHLELILNFVAEDIDAKMHYTEDKKLKREDTDWTFNIFNSAVSDSSFRTYSTPVDRTFVSNLERIGYLWTEIESVFSVFCNWYNNRKLYHLIGLYRHLSTYKKSEKPLSVIRELYREYKKSKKSEFDKYLSDRIGERVKIVAKIEEEIEGNVTKRSKTLSDINYEDDADCIRKILLLHNVQLAIENPMEEARFPFDWAEKLISLEHIHPQNLNLQEIKFDELKEWFESRKEILTQKKVELLEVFERLERNLKDEDTYKENEALCNEDLSIIDKQFDELAGMSPIIKHSIKNLALVDSPTNPALGNNLMDIKRQILKNRQGKSYIPLGTWNAFNKFQSNDVTDLKFWRKEDRDLYFNDIKRVYDLYVK